jgi:hypothetical protein
MRQRFLPTIVSYGAAAACVALCLTGCGGGSDDPPSNVVITSTGTNAVSYWNDVAGRTVIATSATSTTPEELRPNYALDVATVQLAVYDAASAIDGRYRPYAVTPSAPATGASMDAAIAAAAYGTLRALFPNRSAQYQVAYDSFVGGIAAGEAKSKGLALGAEVATGIVGLRANDGRAVALAPYAPGTGPGQFRGVNPVNRFAPSVKPFALTSNSQFRPAPPPALGSDAYATAFNEVKAFGGAVSTMRTAAQLEAARFHTEPPGPLWTRNLLRFATSTADVAEAARLMAFIYVVQADASDACFEAKYFYQAWRPLSAIPLADTATNPATVSDATWAPVLPTPNHPEYPAAHSCASGSLGETLRLYYGTRDVAFSMDSTVTGTTRDYDTTNALPDEIASARVWSGIHFRFSTDAGAQLGVQVADWTWAHYFGRR